MEQRVVELYNKLKALADKGVDGEKDVAYRMLNRLIKKHNISEEDLLSLNMHKRTFHIGTNSTYLHLFHQVAISVIGRKRDIMGVPHKKRPNIYNEAYIYITDEEFVRISFLYETYLKAFKKQLRQCKKDFFVAFVHKNEIYPTDNLEKADNTESGLDAEEALRIRQLMAGIEKTEVNKPLPESQSINADCRK